jgi:hypothetical protein
MMTALMLTALMLTYIVNKQLDDDDTDELQMHTIKYPWETA